jgi:hypothetical protein
MNNHSKEVLIGVDKILRKTESMVKIKSVTTCKVTHPIANIDPCSNEIKV